METTRTITITKGRKNFEDRERRICSNLSFFKDCEYFLFRDDGMKLTISKCGLDVPKRARTGCRNKGMIVFQFPGDMPLDTYKVNEEESNEDKLVINYLKHLEL